jgi:folate-binding protein YgfZ
MDPVRDAAGLVDRSERGKLALLGPDAKAFLNGQVSNDIEALSRGHGCYATLLTPKGKMLADLRVLDTGDGLWLDTERVALQAVFDAIRRFSIGYEIGLEKRTLEQALFSLIGPTARVVAGAAHLVAEHDNRAGEIGGAPVLLIATDLGADVVCAAGDADRVRAVLLDAGAVAVDEAQAEVLRVESGRPRYGVDLDDSVIPQEAGLNERAVSFTKGCYVGQETVARLHWRGKPNRHLRGLRLSAPLPGGEELRLDDRVVGRVSSSVVSPTLGPIALALVRREAPPGTRVSAGEVSAEVVELPFTR